MQVRIGTSSGHLRDIVNYVLPGYQAQDVLGLANYLVWVFYNDTHPEEAVLTPDSKLPRKEQARCLIAARKIHRSPIGNYIFALYLKQGRLP